MADAREKRLPGLTVVELKLPSEIATFNVPNARAMAESPIAIATLPNPL
jgi:hypothetical protein